MLWRIEVRITRTDADPTTADAVVETTCHDAYRKLALAAISVVRQAVDVALKSA
jgi:hypothetical protein